MATPTADKLRIFFPSKYLGADGSAITQQTADAGCTVTEIVDAALTDADDYWDGALGWFDGDTASADLQGVFFHVKDFDAASDTLTLSKPLPAAPAAGDTFRLVLGGNYRSSHETFGMVASGQQPELNPVSGSNITGLTITKASPRLGAGTLSVFYDQSLGEIFIKMDAEAYGVGLDVSTDVTGGIVFAADGQSYIQIDTVAASLPGTDQTDTFTLTAPERTLTPDFEGYETENGIGGKTRYRLEVSKNTDGVDAMVGLSVYAEAPAGDATTISAGQSLGTSEAGVTVDDASAWSTRGFWVRNTTVNAGAGDCRYVKYRSGNTLYCLAVDWATIGFGTGTTQINPGDAISDATTGATAIVDQVTLASGSWGVDAAGTLLLKNVSGSFGNGNNLQVSAATVAVATSASALGLRGLTAVTWNAADAVELMPDIDIGLDAPSTDQYENPADETTAPAGVAFSAPTSTADALEIGNVAAGGHYGVWRREWIMGEHQARPDVQADTVYSWT